MQIECQNLTVGYDGRAILKDINFTVNRGDYLCIIGENGAGKTTLLRTLLGLQPPVSGKILFGDGLERKGCGYLPQQTVIQRDFPASVSEIVLSGCQNRCGLWPFYRKEEKEYAHKMLEKLGIAHLADKCYRELSGGQQQRTLLARALCATQEMLFLDEPVSGLDPAATEEMYRLIEQINREDHILKIGKQIFLGTAQEYLERT